MTCFATARGRSAAAARSAAPDFASGAAAEPKAPDFVAVAVPAAVPAGRPDSYAVLFVDEVVRRRRIWAVEVGGVRL
ncbi:MAG: hypothetical protein QOH07_3438, partial [Mycobacterium sp.]|nr:hypothetical protein [Mycobacterium sp.]